MMLPQSLQTANILLLCAPRKPTTFATVERGGKTKLVFALPGMPSTTVLLLDKNLVLSLFLSVGRLGNKAKPADKTLICYLCL